MSLLHPIITDAHGRRFRLTRYEALVPGSSDPTRHARLMRAGYADAPFQLAWPLYLTIAMLALMLIVGGVALTIWLDLSMWTMGLIVPLAGVLAHGSTVVLTRRFAARAIAQVYLIARYCPSCGYDLTDALPGADGAAPCPECGASWNVPR